MKIRWIIEPGDIVRMGQKQHVQISHDRAEQLLRRDSSTIQHELEDVTNRNLVRIVATEAQKRMEERKEKE